MGAADCLALAALIVLLLPAVVLPWEGRRVPDALYAAIALDGLAAAWLTGGEEALWPSAAGGALAMIAAAALVAAARRWLRVQLLTGGHIKLLAAGAAWLGPGGALAMLALALGGLFALGAAAGPGNGPRRPDFALVAALAVLCVGLLQALPMGDAAPAHAAAARPR